VNVLVQEKDPSSLLNFYRDLLHLRNTTAALNRGSYEELSSHQDVLAYGRTHEDDTLSVYLNFSKKELSISLETHGIHRVLLSTHREKNHILVGSSFYLKPFEAIILKG
jgi:glycosidase